MEEKDIIYLSKERLDEYVAELDYLRNVVRPQVIDEIKEARGQGDLSENAEYDAARDKQAQIESRINEIQHIIENHVLIDTKNKKTTVSIGSTVTIENKKNGERKVLTIVGSLDADPFAKKISNQSPLAKAVLGKKVNEETEVDAPEKYIVKIINIE
ncbi:transcription elongation factor GreA [Mycoplasma sp. 128]|uniref:transcription elongation factor GreA n=1 Tax=Mycoplasma sp. 3341 TaxID=3447506 RepID=UPI003F65DAC8